jgi:RNA polymerase sigma-70 factor (ECF subfamily)
MSHSEPNAGSEAGTRAQFQPTHWSIVLQAADTSTPQAQEALNELCRIYWFPLYAYIRMREPDRHRAKDLTQGFFLYLMQRQIIKRADRRDGRFRSFLLACLQNFLTSEWRKEQAEKRGGRAMVFSIDETEAEEKYGQLPAQEPDPAIRFDRAWAVTLIEHAKANLERTYKERGRPEVYDALSPCLSGELPPDFSSVVPAKLGMTLDAFRVNLFRFREAFGDSVRSEVSKIVAAPEEIDAEIRHLMTAWAGYLQEGPGAPGNPTGK